ncbi:MAG: Glycerate 2-kinase [Chlamydiae bacterium]|nr:Glycerate 2-kinase [Chlamydiota bacterium]
MKVIISPQAFKGSLAAMDVAKAIQSGVLLGCPSAETVLLPVSDGGDGFLDVILAAARGTLRSSIVTGPMGKRMDISWGVLKEPATAVIELAKICGIAMIPPEDRDPLVSTTFGIGEVILEALKEGMQKFLIGIGGSATNDAGVGILQALGARFLDENGFELPWGGGALVDLAEIDLSNLDPKVKGAEFIIGCDVTNPFTGPEGASKVYSPQKGATPEIVSQLEEGLKKFAELIKKRKGIDLNDILGSGAAGGVGGGLHVLLDAQVRLGIDLVLDLIHFDEYLQGADLVITGEGRIDSQTLYNKAPIGVAKRAKQMEIPVIAIAGSLGDGYQAVHKQGIDTVIPLRYSSGFSENVEKLVVAAAEEAIRSFVDQG